MSKSLLTSIFVLIFILLFNPELWSEQVDIKGSIKNKDAEPLIGANIYLEEISNSKSKIKLGSKSDSKGNFEIKKVEIGKYNIFATYIGFKKYSNEIQVNDKLENIEIVLEDSIIENKTIEVVASRAKNRETPIAFTDISKESVEMSLAGRDVTMAMNYAPGIYATEGGGGFGDSRVNLRGFTQRNISVMINGVPVNDMENGQVFWSNFEGIGDVTASKQIQRGLGAGKLANPSIGGTINILTDAALLKPGIKVRQEIGEDALMKTVLVANTGKVGDWAFTFAGVRKTGDSYVDKLWGDIWSYYMGASWDINENQKLDFYVMGAPQQHGQRSFKSKIGVYSFDEANSFGIYDDLYDSVLAQSSRNGINLSKSQVDSAVKTKISPSESERGFSYNPHWGVINSKVLDSTASARGRTYDYSEYYNGAKHDYKSKEYINERVNYFHKPQANINWLWNIDQNLSLTNVFYISTGQGGGSDRVGPSFATDYTYGNRDLMSAIEFNMRKRTSNLIYDSVQLRSDKILGNNVNNHLWAGWLGTIDWKSDEAFTHQFGLDLRYYNGEHFREVRNLLGGDYFIETIRNANGTFVDSTGNMNIANNKQAYKKYLGDKIGFYYDGYVNWLGAFYQGEYKKDDISAYINTSISNTSYKRIDHFRTAFALNGNETDWQTFLGYTVKAGANYNINKEFNLFGNAGYYSRPPQFNAVFQNDNALIQNPLNEKVLAGELGIGYWSNELTINLNFYYTKWMDKSWIKVRTLDTITYNFNLTGVDALHKGVELDLEYKITKYLKIKGMAAIGDWRWTNDVVANYSPEDNPNQIYRDTIYSKDLKVGDAAQTTFALSLNYRPFRKSNLILQYRHYSSNYADFDPISRTNKKDIGQSWEMPAYSLLDFHASYTLPLELDFNISLRLNVTNILDEVYMTDGTDNRLGARDKEGVLYHDAANAEVFYGRPRFISAGLQLDF